MLTAVFKEPSSLYGTVESGQIQLSGIGDRANAIVGGGAIKLTNVELGGTEVMRSVGQRTGREFGGVRFNSADATHFEVGNGALSSRDLELRSNAMMMELRGDYYFGGSPTRGIPPKTIDAMMRINFIQSMLGQIPIIKEFGKIADELAGALLLAFRISGTSDRPQISPIALPLFQGAAP